MLNAQAHPDPSRASKLFFAFLSLGIPAYDARAALSTYAGYLAQTQGVDRMETNALEKIR
jgi:hypothetical protein